LSTLAGLFNSVQCLLRAVRKKEDGWNAFIAGGVSGLALFIEPKESRTDLSVYLFVQALANLLRLKVQNSEYKSSWFANLENSFGGLFSKWDILTFSMFGGIIQYAFVWEPDTMDYTVYNFLFTMTSNLDKQALKYLRELCYQKWSKVKKTVPEKEQGKDGIVHDNNQKVIN